MPSQFFLNFSLEELVSNKFPSLSQHSGTRGSVGGGSFAGHGLSHYRRSQSVWCPGSKSSKIRFDENELTKSLMAGLEQVVLENEATINADGYIPGKFNSCEFFVEYTQESIQGRIIISGNMEEDAYRLRADIEERSHGEKTLFPREVFGNIRPDGDYHVVAFGEDDPLARNDSLHHIGAELIKESSKRIPAGFSKSDAANLQYAEVWTLYRLPQHMNELFQQRGLGQRIEHPEEYEKYKKVCFLNEVALNMYEDAGIRLQVLKRINSADMPRGCNRNLRGPYIPK